MVTPLRKGMTTDDAVRYLRRYQQWRRGHGEKDFEQAGLNVSEVGQALDTLLGAIPAMKKEITSLSSRLAKCQVQREKFHFELRSKRNNVG